MEIFDKNKRSTLAAKMHSKNNNFKGEYCLKIIDYLSRGKSPVRFMADHDMSKSTFYEYLDKYPPFAEAYQIAKTKAEAYYADMIEDQMGNPDFQYPVYKHLVGSRFGDYGRIKVHTRGLQTKNIMKSFDAIMKQFTHGDIDLDDLKKIIEFFMSVATLKEREELTKRIEALELRIKDKDEEPL